MTKEELAAIEARAKDSYECCEDQATEDIKSLLAHVRRLEAKLAKLKNLSFHSETGHDTNCGCGACNFL